MRLKWLFFSAPICLESHFSCPSACVCSPVRATSTHFASCRSGPSSSANSSSGHRLRGIHHHLHRPACRTGGGNVLVRHYTRPRATQQEATAQGQGDVLPTSTGALCYCRNARRPLPTGPRGKRHRQTRIQKRFLTFAPHVLLSTRCEKAFYTRCIVRLFPRDR